jgi:hypothetical protein
MFNSLLINKKKTITLRNLLRQLKAICLTGMSLSILTTLPSITKMPWLSPGEVLSFVSSHGAGIDFAGTVSASSHPEYQVGDQVLLTGWGVGKTLGRVIRKGTGKRRLADAASGWRKQ